MRRAPFVLAAVFLAGCGGGGAGPAEKSAAKPEVPTYFKVDAATAGKVSGKIDFKGAKPVRKVINVDDDDCKKTMTGQLLAEDVVVNKNGTLANVFVWVKSGLEGKKFEPATVKVTFDQRGCQFRPHAVPIRVGQTMAITNSDQVTHNVHPLPCENREWNQGQPSGAAPVEREFSKPEIGIAVKCNVHAWMRSYIHVVDHPYFAVSGEDGVFEIKDLPPGQYTVEAWHEKLGAQTVSVTIAANGAATADFTFQAK